MIAKFSNRNRNGHSFLRVGKGAEMTIGNKVGISSTVLWRDNKIIIGDNAKRARTWVDAYRVCFENCKEGKPIPHYLLNKNWKKSINTI